MVRVCSLPSPIPLAFIIVTKRINTRFFLKGVQPAFVNPRCGTVCDNTVTSSHLYDFFLISQHTTQGTAQPVHYNVIHDNLGVSPNNQQRLAHTLTHLYYNWPVSSSSCLWHHQSYNSVFQLTREHWEFQRRSNTPTSWRTWLAKQAWVDRPNNWPNSPTIFDDFPFEFQFDSESQTTHLF